MPQINLNEQYKKAVEEETPKYEKEDSSSAVQLMELSDLGMVVASAPDDVSSMTLRSVIQRIEHATEKDVL
ncbi:hypothetical protein FXO38_04903 [Capsicum annuum]|uniref:Uncharacterized protein n=1 Tax=Capsicum annuum TaxID=4072 RepID=A0A2G2YWK0_CAPAN|nr:hypothetical protein FXO37_36277 [Capsicum annuum]KAF3675089.1 hypothetical protein FXO38_04903 [Capsicum annuum]PHT74147.1 hypothetical protein T459_21424 [Capsicum annuum]